MSDGSERRAARVPLSLSRREPRPTQPLSLSLSLSLWRRTTFRDRASFRARARTNLRKIESKRRTRDVARALADRVRRVVLETLLQLVAVRDGEETRALAVATCVVRHPFFRFFSSNSLQPSDSKKVCGSCVPAAAARRRRSRPCRKTPRP